MTDPTSIISFGDFTEKLVPLLQTLIVATFGYVAHLLRDIRKQVTGLRSDVLEIERRYEKHEVRSEEIGQRYTERFREVERRMERMERFPIGGVGGD